MLKQPPPPLSILYYPVSHFVDAYLGNKLYWWASLCNPSHLLCCLFVVMLFVFTLLRLLELYISTPVLSLLIDLLFHHQPMSLQCGIVDSFP